MSKLKRKLIFVLPIVAALLFFQFSSKYKKKQNELPTGVNSTSMAEDARSAEVYDDVPAENYDENTPRKTMGSNLLHYVAINPYMASAKDS